MAVRTKEKPSNGQPAVLANPDGLGDKGRAAVAAQLYVSIEVQREELVAQQAANEHDDNDGVPSQQAPSGFMQDRDGSIINYGQRKERLGRSLGNLVKEYDDIREAFEEAVKEQRQKNFGA